MVIDGIPVSNDPVMNSYDGNKSDYGGSLDKLTPVDTESVNVLKGVAASDFYDSRVANGALVITSRSGKGNKGSGVSFTTDYTKKKPLRLPKFQNSFGDGTDVKLEELRSGFRDTGLYSDRLNEDWDESWGPALDRSLIPQFDSSTKNGFRSGDKI